MQSDKPSPPCADFIRLCPAFNFKTHIMSPDHYISNFEKPLWEEDEDVLVEDDISSGMSAHIVVYNDEFNTFEWVIECFMAVLKHSNEQAEQLSLIIHFKGKATVKSGSRDELVPLCEALLERGLSAEVITGE
jgi:ATP-dependent Clp protease adaptor protein ClpS